MKFRRSVLFLFLVLVLNPACSSFDRRWISLSGTHVEQRWEEFVSHLRDYIVAQHFEMDTGKATQAASHLRRYGIEGLSTSELNNQLIPKKLYLSNIGAASETKNCANYIIYEIFEDTVFHAQVAGRYAGSFRLLILGQRLFSRAVVRLKRASSGGWENVKTEEPCDLPDEFGTVHYPPRASQEKPYIVLPGVLDWRHRYYNFESAIAHLEHTALHELGHGALKYSDELMPTLFALSARMEQDVNESRDIINYLSEKQGLNTYRLRTIMWNIFGLSMLDPSKTSTRHRVAAITIRKGLEELAQQIHELDPHYSKDVSSASDQQIHAMAYLLYKRELEKRDYHGEPCALGDPRLRYCGKLRK